MLSLDIRNDEQRETPAEPAMREAVQAALRIAGHRGDAEVSLCILGAQAMRELNHRYRDRDYPTNVLSFPADLPPEVQLPHLGDIVVCAPQVECEAREQHKAAPAHWAHLLVHGTLHLLGYDHLDDDEAQRMEALETRALAALGWPCPYREQARSVAPEQTRARQAAGSNSDPADREATAAGASP